MVRNHVVNPILEVTGEESLGVTILARERNVDHYVAGTPMKLGTNVNAFAISTVNTDARQITGDFGSYFQWGEGFASVGQSRKAGSWMVTGFESIHEAMLYTNQALGFEVPRPAVLPQVS